MIQRTKDWLRERRIKAAGRRSVAALRAGDKAGARWWCDTMVTDIKARSPQQVERMERRRGLRISQGH